MAISIGNREIGDGQPCFITFEAGPTHDGLESAKRLVKLAAEAGADAVKFQIFDPERLVADKKMPFSYDILVDRATGKTETVEEPLYDIFCRRALSPDEWKKLKTYSDSLGLVFFSTVGFEEEVQLLEELNCHSIKIASADVNHFPLIRRVAKTGKCVQLDTGNATIGEVEKAVDVCRSEGNNNIIIHNCPSGYPARLESINLRLIPTLKQMFPDYPIAYSDHTPGWEMDVAAVALGANLVEKTITEDRTTPSVEHIFSLEPFEMKSFIQTIRDVEIALGQARRNLYPEELEKRKNIRRSIFLKSAVRKGQKIGDVEVDFRRPGFGLGPDMYEQLQNFQFVKDLPAGHQLSLKDLV
ncbi:N-acetylneuraminate synthase family protein [uncultured Desulfobacter sp.]|uniref:N-acetylneuraminate synthase family protein n=1 Tax=uncultured Desulfobacter sp. TaxID=240139 RepID=UPI002AA7CB20|nr:N-acetylneuraminate synthase family protein [uncultured Desulfobacter sp.]